LAMGPGCAFRPDLFIVPKRLDVRHLLALFPLPAEDHVDALFFMLLLAINPSEPVILTGVLNPSGMFRGIRHLGIS
jgi:hypothetical protein